MPISRRVLMASATAAALFSSRRDAVAQSADAPVATIRRFYDTLLGVMKQAKRISFEQRYQLLAPAITQTFNLPLMSRIAVGPTWAQMTPEQQQRISGAFSHYTISTYASRFDDYGGERFEVDPTPANSANGPLVQTRLIKSNGEPVTLNYLMRQGSSGWQIIDVYLSGTISELATRRSEFAAVLQRGGADALVQMLETRAAAMRTG